MSKTDFLRRCTIALLRWPLVVLVWFVAVPIYATDREVGSRILRWVGIE